MAILEDNENNFADFANDKPNRDTNLPAGRQVARTTRRKQISRTQPGLLLADQSEVK
jgi:hypothetical protein